MIKTINTGVAELTLILLKDGADDLPRWIEENQLRLAIYGGTIDFDLPNGKWEELGIAHDLSEEVWDSLIGKRSTFAPAVFFYPDYSNISDHWAAFDTATESGLSLLRANDIFSENPFGIHEIECGETCSCVAGCYQSQNWYDAQKNTGKWVVLKKTNV